MLNASAERMIEQACHGEHDRDRNGGFTARDRERFCVATRTVRPIDELIRFVVGPDGETVPDIKGRLPGRGVWVTATQEALEDAIRRGAFARGFKRNVRLPADLAAQTAKLLEHAVLDALAIAGKAGLVAAGFARCAAVLRHSDVVALLHARDAAAEGVRKLNAVVSRRGKPIPVIEFLTSAQLDLALGRPNVVHAALLAGPASSTFLLRLRRLQRYRTGGAGDRGNLVGKGAAH
jgi:uncharacterized protein